MTTGELGIQKGGHTISRRKFAGERYESVGAPYQRVQWQYQNMDW